MRPVSVSELNRRATLEYAPPKSGTPAHDPLDGMVITDEYERVRELLKAGAPVVFVTGNAGTGKTTLIRYLRSVLDLRMVVVAPTGVGALNAEGGTIHSLFQLPPRIHEEKDIKLAYDRRLFQKLELLIIDEVSMVRCDLLDSVDKFLRKNRSDDRPFGGVQVLLVGDLFQLTPVAHRHEWDVLRSRGYLSPYFFSSFCLKDSSLTGLELTHVYRQEDRAFVYMLDRIRVGEDVDPVIAELNGRCGSQEDLVADITLACTNMRADQINRFELGLLASEEHTFTGRIEGQFSIEQDKLPSPFDLTLKAGARVMFTKNDAGRRWVNGTLGTVRDASCEGVRVQLAGEEQETVCDVLPATWERYRYAYDAEEEKIVARVVGAYRQYPLMLAWAVTIHKSQGQTLDKVLVDLGNGAFASGQLYVALSRCRSVDGIRLTRPIRRADVICDPVIRRFYRAIGDMEQPGRSQ